MYVITCGVFHVCYRDRILLNVEPNQNLSELIMAKKRWKGALVSSYRFQDEHSKYVRYQLELDTNSEPLAPVQ